VAPASGIAASGAVDDLLAGTGIALRRKSAATVESELATNITGNRRQMELRGSRMLSAMRCPPSKHSVCQSKRRVRAVSTTAGPIRRDSGAPEDRRRSAGQDFPTGSSRAAFLHGLGGVQSAIARASR